MHEDNQLTIEAGSKSFALAARLFTPESRRSALALYAWCRYCDDQIDEAPDAKTAHARLMALESRLAGGAALSDPRGEAAFVGLAALQANHTIPAIYAEDLLRGMRMDVEGTTYETPEELRLYAYRVAGTVGLMMACILGVSDTRALAAAAHLGIAMQFTNIARDVREDFENGRMYLPLAWFDEIRANPRAPLDPRQSAEVFACVERLLTTAREHYALGEAGIRYLPWRAGMAVRSATRIYSAIGDEIRTTGVRALDRRTIVPRWRKRLLLGGAVARSILELPLRAFLPWKPVAQLSAWRLP